MDAKDKLVLLALLQQKFTFRGKYERNVDEIVLS